MYFLEEVYRNVYVEKLGMAFEESVLFYGIVFFFFVVWGSLGRLGDRFCFVFLRVMGEG